MEPIPLKNYCEELEILDFSPILGNKSMSQDKFNSQNPKLAHLIRPRVNSATSVAGALSPGPKTPRSKKRTLSESSLTSPQFENVSKMSKSDFGDLKDLLGQMETRMVNKMDSTEQTLSNKFDSLSGQIADLRTKHDQEVNAREQLQDTVNTLKEQVVQLGDRVDKAPTHDPEEVARILLPQVKSALSAEIKTHENQVKATYFQSLVNELKAHEKDMMIYGYKSEGGPDLAGEIRKKLLKEVMELNIEHIKAIQVGSAVKDKPKPIRVSFQSAEIRNSVLVKGRKLPKEVRIEKCMPRRYRQKNRDFKEYSWQLKETTNVMTRTVFKGHKLVLEMKQHDDPSTDTKYDWTIVKEYYPEPESPTDRSEAHRSRVGLIPSQTIEMVNINKVILSDLSPMTDKMTTMAYFQNVYLIGEDRKKVLFINGEQVMSKRIIVITLSDRKECFDFKTKYEKLEFNGKNPRISVFLGKD